jgi:hypothetical protein
MLEYWIWMSLWPCPQQMWFSWCESGRSYFSCVDIKIADTRNQIPRLEKLDKSGKPQLARYCCTTGVRKPRPSDVFCGPHAFLWFAYCVILYDENIPWYLNTRFVNVVNRLIGSNCRCEPTSSLPKNFKSVTYRWTLRGIHADRNNVSWSWYWKITQTTCVKYLMTDSVKESSWVNMSTYLQ